MKKFTKNIENFQCFNCNSEVIGNGYTNHCPNCLWSLHVDINPGDRANNCLGKMRPVSVICKTNQYKIIHECTKCRERRTIKANEQDSIDALATICKN